ncbi:FAD-binding oxidoreductase [Alkalinema pantanalense CENA528]|uniref:FAD-binding oxidoreductase n=1 Tax=Alkalinema pantanalense TaxID=1620705 RepID=UPI003D6DB08A
MSLTRSILTSLGSYPGLQRADQLWQSLREGTLSTPQVVETSDQALPTIGWDVLICGGTLGILVGAVLAQRGYRVAVLEQGILQGRSQEWNISRQELQKFVQLGLLTEAELATTIATEFNPIRISFAGQDIWVKDVLNIGVDPVRLLAILKQKFLDAGGDLLEQTPFKGCTVHPNGVAVRSTNPSIAPQSSTLQSSPNELAPPLTARLMLDVMGHFSPVTRQARNGQKPDAVCLVVGTCATGYPDNPAGDLIASFTPIQNQCQYFWEAFPARDGRTTYLFTYLDAEPDRISLETLFDEYFRLLPSYQSIDLDALQFQRALFGMFPCYRNSPLQPTWDRILAIGDSSGAQSPLSFGGFGAMVRHLERLTQGLDEALQADVLDRRSLSRLQPYQPNLQVTWLFQKSMSVGVNQTLEPDQINQLLRDIFQEMQGLGDPVLKPFLQDVVQFVPLFKTLAQAAIAHPLLILKILPQVGFPALFDWLGHYGNLAIYTVLHWWSRSFANSLQTWIATLPPDRQYFWHCRLAAWKYGSGADYED